MKKIIIIGDSNNEMSEKLCKTLEEYSGALLVTSDSIIDFSLSNALYLICSLDNYKEILTDNSIIVFKQDYDQTKIENRFFRNNYAIYFEKSLDYNYKNELVIGHTENCDLIISSCSENSICLSLNKPIYTLKNKQIMPCEIKINVNKNNMLDSITIITAAVIMLLCDENDEKALELCF